MKEYLLSLAPFMHDQVQHLGKMAFVLIQCATMVAVAAWISFIIPQWVENTLKNRYLQDDKKIESKQTKATIQIILLTMSIVGACAGLLGGLSRVGAVGSIIPAFLSLIAGVTIFLIDADNKKGWIVPMAVTSLSLSLFIAYIEGSYVRGNAETRMYCEKIASDPKIIGNPDALVNFKNFMGEKCKKYFVIP